MKPVLIALVIAAASLASSGAADLNQLSPKEKAAGWKLLFDGTSTGGWRGYKKPSFPSKGWKVEDGLLKKVGGEQGGDIITEATFDNFDLTWEWRIALKGNNGLKYLVTEERAGAPGHEYQMIDDTGHPDGRLGAKRTTAAFYDVLPPRPDKPLNPPGQWNQSRVLVQGNHIEHWLNGQKVLEYDLGSDAVKAALAGSKFKNAAGFGTKLKGHIMLTDHSDECWFRNVKIRELPAK